MVMYSDIISVQFSRSSLRTWWKLALVRHTSYRCYTSTAPIQVRRRGGIYRESEIDIIDEATGKLSVKKWAWHLKQVIAQAKASVQELERVLDKLEANSNASRRTASEMMDRIESREPKPEDFGLPARTPRPDYEYVGLRKWSRNGGPNRFYVSKS